MIREASSSIPSISYFALWYLCTSGCMCVYHDNDEMYMYTSIYTHGIDRFTLKIMRLYPLINQSINQARFNGASQPSPLPGKPSIPDAPQPTQTFIHIQNFRVQKVDTTIATAGNVCARSNSATPPTYPLSQQSIQTDVGQAGMDG